MNLLLVLPLLPLLQFSVTGPVELDVQVAVTINTPPESPYPIELSSSCDSIWDDDDLGGGVVTPFDNSPSDHEVSSSGSCAVSSESLDLVDSYSLPVTIP